MLISGVHKGWFSKGGLAIDVFVCSPLCKRNLLGSVFYLGIEDMPNC